MDQFALLRIFWVFYLCISQTRAEDCKKTVKGLEYRGKISVTNSGRTCQRWDSQSPHSQAYGSYLPGGPSAHDNFCRNPKDEASTTKPWCYTTDPRRRWEYCNVPFCGSLVNSVSPNYGSMCGETRILIRGIGFSKDNVNEGNKVRLVSSTTSYDCPVLKDGTTEEDITCYTPSGMKTDTYYVRLNVDGEDVPIVNHCRYPTDHRCRVMIRVHSTPTITSVEPSSGPPESIIKITGKIVTDRFDTNVETATNGRTEKIARVYAGPELCSLKAENDVFYGKQLNNENTWNGYLKCKMNGKFIGNQNVSYIVSGAFGRSCRPNSLFLSRTKQLYLFQSYAEITSVSPKTGSVHGGTLITITGKNFDQTQSPTKVKISGQSCEVKSVTETQITCQTPSKPDTAYSIYAGNRGLLLEVWNKTNRNLDRLHEVLTFNESFSDYMKSHLDRASYYDDVINNFVTRQSGFFVPPWTGDYSFAIQADDIGLLYFSNTSNPDDMDLIAKCRSYSYRSYTRWPSEQLSKKFRLTAGEAYYMTILHKDGWGPGAVKVAALFYQTELTNQSTSFARQEHQQIEVKSTVVREVQNILLVTESVQPGVHEVQRVEICDPSNGGAVLRFRLGFYKVYTDLLTSQSSASAIKNALQSLPLFHSHESVKVINKTMSSGCVLMFVELVSNRGNFEDLKVIMKNTGVTVNTTVQEVQAGKPTGEYFALEMAGVISPLFTGKPNELQMAGNLGKMFESRCPRALGNPVSKRLHFGFESGVRPNGMSKGTVVADVEAFCGRKCVKNPNLLYYDKSNRISLGQSVKVVCFAYRGKLQNFLKLGYSYRNSAGNTLDNQYAYPAPTFQQSAGWNYKCIDMLAAVQAGRVGTSFKIFFIEIRKDSSEDFYYVDEIYVGKDPTNLDEENVNLMRMRPSMPGGSMVNYANVTLSDVNGTAAYQVEFIPFACAYNFPLLAGVPGQVSNGTSLIVSRVSAASPPISGNFSVTFQNKTMDGIPFIVDGTKFGTLLQSGIPEMGNLYTYRHGGCSAFSLHVGFHSNAGDQETIQITSYAEGENVTVDVKTMRDGNVWLDTIPGDMLATPHKTPQVMAYINDIPTHCVGDCSWEWSQSATPTINSVYPTTGFPTSTNITINGTGFHGNNSLNSVMIGGVACMIISSNSTEIVCSVGDGPTGSFPVMVNVGGSGTAENINNSVVFTYQFSIQSMAPSSVSLGGGLNLTLAGYGFSTKDVVYVDDSLCSTLSSSSTQIECLIPPSSENKNASVTVTQGNTGTNFTHNATLLFSNEDMISISSIIPNSTFVAGGTEITIQGIGVNKTESVMIGNKPVSIRNSSDTEIKVVLPAMPAGAYPIKLLGATGFAVDSTNTIPSVEWRLIVSSVAPLQGSLRGGTKLTIAGDGFSTNKTRNSVMVGSHVCEMESATVNELRCQIKDTAKVHVVDNSGIHPSFKLSGYAWNPQYLTVRVGDTVEWKWSFASYITGMRPRVVQVKDESSVEEVEGGFNSGAPRESGVFRHQFTVPGKYCYWSDYIDQYKTTWFRGCVTVEDQSSSVADVIVKVNGFEALYQKVAPQSPLPASSGCSGDSNSLSNCTVPQPSGGDPTKFNFKFWTCATPVITGLSESNGTVNTNITIRGTGLSNNHCQNEISFGDGKCVGDGNSGSDVVCNIDSSNSPTIGVLQPITVRHNNLGYALVALNKVIARSFALMPVVTMVMPTNGSVAGGTLVQIHGSGFSTVKESISVTIGGYPCDVENMTYSMIECSTRAGQGEKELAVKIKSSQGQWVPAVCQDVCKFSYDAALTPTIVSASPSVVNGTEETTLVIGGSNFGNDSAAISVKIGGEDCRVTSVSNSSVHCVLRYLPAGSNNQVVVKVTGRGLASGNVKVGGASVIMDISPAEGSIHGGTVIHISGNGFVDKLTSITVKGKPCPIVNLNLSDVSCITPSNGNEETVELRITSNQIAYPVSNFNYSNQVSPNISSINPTNGSAGTELTITGTNFASEKEKISVTIGKAECAVISSSETEINCTAGASLVGTFPGLVTVDGKGKSDQDSQFEYQLLFTSISPNTGGIAGDQLVTISGSGFDNYTTVWICDRKCEHDSSANLTASQLSCRTPKPADGNLTCTVNVTTNGVSRILVDAYTYNPALTANVTMVTPARGGTAGGTTLTIQGTGFGSVKAAVTVTIAGTVCDVRSVAPTQITCVTNQHGKSQKTNVRVEVSGNGKAIQTSAEFFYIDVWSSRFTWGGGPLPKEGDLVVITPGQTILLDVSPPKLTLLLIQGGALIFDEKDLVLKAVNILIVKNGLLQVGTEEKPFENRAEIVLHGNHRTKEYPIYGTKSLAVREGNLELHGKPVPIPWTTLDKTASAGNSTIVLKEAVTWKAGDKIVIATTSHRHSQKETELRVIQAVANDNRTITLTEPLKYEHLGVTETFDGTDVDFRAEVGMVSRNVIVRGDSNKEFEEKIEACPDGFDTGEFATQTCFQGRFGEEMGSDQFGAQIMIHSPKQSGSMSHARLEYVEVTHAGQAFRLGRYPIHFHLNGDTNGSYVRGCGIYNTFNRAINIHGSHNILVEHNVAYNVMGGAFFFEDGIETGSTVQYNLLMFVRESSSLQNDDVTPAAYWVTNPDNTIQHNRAVGGTHFGFWYRMHKHPDGPSFDSSICPQHIPVRVFRNNTAHSNGWFGLWIFATIKTREGGKCSSTTPAMSLFESLTAWNNEKGAEIVNGGALECRDFVLVNNQKAGYEGKLIIEGDQLFKDLLIVGHAPSLTRKEQGCTRAGFILPYGNGMTIDGVRFVNFDESNCVGLDFARIDGTCSVNCGGYYYETRNLKWVAAPNKGTYPWPWAGVLRDLDGTLIGETGNAASIAANAGKAVISASDTLPPSCVSFPKFSNKSGSIPARACPPGIKYHRFSFNGISPSALNYKDFIFVNRHGNDSVPWRKKAITHKLGWMTVLLDGEDYFYYFKDAGQITNISYTGTFDRFQKNNSGSYEYVIMRQKVSARPDRFMIDGRTNIEPTRNIDGNTVHGQWEYLKNDNEIKYIISSKKSASRRKRSVADENTYSVTFRAYKCYYVDCIAPVDPNTVPPVTKRPYDFNYWSEKETWKNAQKGWGGYISNGTYDLPKDGDDVKINKGQWVVADVELPSMGKLVLYGVLELDGSNGTKNFVLNCTYIIIFGGRLIVGWPDNPFPGKALILLHGQHSTPRYPTTSGPPVGSKAIGVFGGLDLHGKDVATSWTLLEQTANPGDNRVTLVTSVTWKVGDEIVIAPTDFSVWETETFGITAVSGNGKTLTLNSTLKYKHIAHTETAGDQSMTMAAEVGLLTRNIRVEGAAYDKLYKESFGARILVGRTQDPDNSDVLYIGYARISNVEFYHSGQEGWVEPSDARGSIAYVDAGTVSNIKPSFVKKCAFHKGFSPAIMAYGTNKLPIEGNVIADTVWYAVESMSEGTMIKNNFVTKVQWEGSYNNRRESSNFRYNGAFNLDKATNLVLENNHVGGAERLGFRTTGEPCDVTPVNPWTGNVVHTALVGVGLLPINPLPGYLKTCAMYSNFTLWKNLDYGIFYIGSASSSVVNLKAADNGVSVFQFIMGPAALSHRYADKYANVKNSFILGTSDELNCATALGDKSDFNIAVSRGKIKFHSSPLRIGVTMPTFSSGSNACPNMPCNSIMSYQTIKGIFKLQDVTFSKFSKKCNSRGDRAVAPNKANDDGNHPFITQRIKFFNVAEDNKIIYWRSSIGKINSADCVDMACDAKVKCLLQDLDGTFLNSSGFIIPQSEYEWNGNPKMGLGDYRIPKEMLVRSNGSRIPVSEIAPHKGIIRTDSCQYRAAWQAYECHDLNYKTLVIESMDADTETRRLSPLAILGDGYLDLINGPQDHGWCSGYTCRKRLSTFQAIVATDKSFLMHYTSVSPQKTRFFLLDAKPNDCIILSIWYSQPWRLDVYHNGEFILPPNARFEGADKRYVVDPPPVGKPDYYKPNITGCTTQKSGLSYFNRDTGIITLMIKGPAPVEIVTVKTVIVSFQLPAMPEAEFYGKNIVMNLASFLNVDASCVRITKIVRETSSSSRRRKRAAGKVTGVEIEISNPPSQEINSTAQSGDLSSDQLQNITTNIVNDVQLGGALRSIVNITGVAISEPPPDPADSNWQKVAEETNNNRFQQLVQPSAMRLSSPVVPIHEGAPFSTQPKFQIFDADGNVVKKLGTLVNPWVITATLRNGSGNAGQLLGSRTASYDNGWANFTDLAISHMGADYVIDFAVTYPVSASFSLSSSKISISRRALVIAIRNITSDPVENSDITMDLQLRDKVTSQVIEQINWRNHKWIVNVALDGMDYYRGQLNGNTTTTFDANSSLATLSNFSFSARGMVVMKISVTSDPPEYSLKLETLIHVLPQRRVQSFQNSSQDLQLRFEADYDTIVGTQYLLQFQAMMGNYLSNLYPDIILNSVKITKGSILVTFKVSGTSSMLNSTVSTLCSAVANGTNFNFRGTTLRLSSYLSVDGQNYYGSKCAVEVIPNGKPEEPLPTGVIVGLSVVGTVLLIMIIAIVIWRIKVVPKTQTHCVTSAEYMNKSESVDMIVQNDKVDESVDCFVNENYEAIPPADTGFSTFKRNAGSSTESKSEIEK